MQSSSEGLQKPSSGDYRLALTGAPHPWPVIVCNDELLPPDVPHPVTAEVLPVLYLGMNKRAWISVEDLYPIDPVTPELEPGDDVSADLQDAHAIASMFHPLDYFKDEAIARSLAGDPDIESATKPSSDPREVPRKGKSTKRRKGRGHKRAPQARESLEYQDDDDEDIFTKEATQEGFVAGLDPEGLYDEPSEMDGVNRERGSKRPRQGQRAGSSISIKEEDSEDNPAISVHVGKSNTKFDFKRSELSESPVLLQGVVYAIGRRPYVMNPDLMVLEENDFQAIEQYLKTSDYHPYLINDGAGQAHLAGLTNTKERQKAGAIELIRCGRLYCMAGFFQLPNLQGLILRKLKAIKAYAAGPILETTKFVFENLTDPEDELRKYLVNFVAENFKSLNLKDPKAFWETLDASDELHIAVFRRKAEIVNDFGVIVKLEDD